MAWCLIKQYADAFRKALKNGEVDPVKLSTMSSLERRNYLAKYVGEENAVQTNALFESKLLLKNQKAGMIAWAKRVSGIKPMVKQDLISRIERMEKVLDPDEIDQFLNDLVNTRLKIEVTQEEAKQIADFSKEMVEARDKADANGVFPSEEDRLSYGAKAVALKKYVDDLKIKSRQLTWSEDKQIKALEVIKRDIPSLAKSMKSSLDNSFWGRQGIPVLLNPKTSKLWVKNFMKSWNDVAGELKGVDMMDIIKADIYSRPNSINGKYRAGGYGLDIMTEEAFPSSAPEKIPVLKRLFKASQSAYNGGALRLRADLADRYIALAEKNGINTLDPEQAKGIGQLVSSLTGRGSLGRLEPASEQINVMFFSAKFLKSKFDIVTAHQFDSKATAFSKKEAAKNLFNITMTVAAVMTLASMLSPDDVEKDPRATNFGRIRIFGKWTDITGGLAAIVTLAMRMIPTPPPKGHEEDGWGWWFKSASGNWSKLGAEEQRNAWDGVLIPFFEGKLSPAFNVMSQLFKGDFYGEPLTPSKAVKELFTPLPLDNALTLLRDPDASFVLGSILLDALGFSTSVYPMSNKVTQAIPTDKLVNDGTIMSYIQVYSKAYDIDPATMWDRVFSGQRIMQISADKIIVVDRDDDWDERKKEYAKKYGVNAKDIKEVREEHIIPIAGGGADADDNRVMIAKSLHTEFTKVDNAYIKALKERRITKAEGEKLITKYKMDRIKGVKDSMTQEEILKILTK